MRLKPRIEVDRTTAVMGCNHSTREPGAAGAHADGLQSAGTRRRRGWTGLSRHAEMPTFTESSGVNMFFTNLESGGGTITPKLLESFCPQGGALNRGL